jgi:predicted N-acyltransferase
VRTHSLHWIADMEFASAIGEFLRRENVDVGQVLDELHESSPYKAVGASDGGN